MPPKRASKRVSVAPAPVRAVSPGESANDTNNATAVDDAGGVIDVFAGAEEIIKPSKSKSERIKTRKEARKDAKELALMAKGKSRNRENHRGGGIARQGVKMLKNGKQSQLGKKRKKEHQKMKKKEAAKEKAKAKAVASGKIAPEELEAIEAGNDDFELIDDDDWDDIRFCDCSMASYIMLFAVVLYFVMGVAFYTQHPETQWTVVDALYFCMVTLTTVGYGDNESIKHSDSLMLFSSFFVLYAVGAIATAVSHVIDWYIEKQELVLEELQDELLDAMLDDDEEAEFRLMEARKQKAKGLRCPTKVELLKYFGVIAGMSLITFGGMGFMMAYEGWTATQAWYWLCVTGTTVGYGDYSPGTDEGKMFAFFYLPICTPVFSYILISVFGTVFSIGSANKEDNVMDEELTNDMIDQMDKDGDHTVTREEWLAAMLVRLHYVDANVIEKISKRFSDLDTDHSGTLSIKDLVPTTAPPEPASIVIGDALLVESIV